jgi:hypothetical protein
MFVQYTSRVMDRNGAKKVANEERLVPATRSRNKKIHFAKKESKKKKDTLSRDIQDLWLPD